MPQAAAAVVFQFAGWAASAAGASTLTALKVASTAVKLGATASKIALLAAANKVVAHQNKPRPQGGMIRLSIAPDEPRRLQIGTRINAGVLVDWYVTGSKNQRLFMIVYLGEGPMGPIRKVYGGGRAVYTTTINHGTRTTIPNYRSGGDRLWVTYYDGRPGQTADSTLTALGLGWTSECVGTGCAYAIIEALWDSDNQTSPPQISFEMDGAKLYDRRKDTTAGGSGSHRANSPATWEVSTNPAVALDHYLLGRYLSGVKTFGIGLAASDVPYARFEALANLCDEDVTISTGGTQNRYEASGFLFADRTYADTIRDLCRAMNARPADFGGRIGVLDGEEKTPVLTIADSDVIDSVPESYTPKRSWGEMVNVVRGTYQSPGQLYQATEYVRITDSAWVTQDGGGVKEATLDLEMETDGERAQRLAWLHAKRERRQAILTGAYTLRCIELEQGDWFTRTGGIFGDGKTFEVIDRVLDPETFNVIITAFEVDPADTAWTTDIPSDSPPAGVPNDQLLQDMQVPSLTVTGVTLTGTAAQLPAIWVQWTAPTDPRARQIVVEAVPEVGGVPVAQVVDVATAQVVFTNGITDDTDYLVRARFIGQYIPSAWTSNVAVTTEGDYSVGTATSVPWSGLTGAIPDTVNNAKVPLGQNRLRYSRGERVTGYWTYFSSGPAVTFGAFQFAGYTGLNATCTFTAAGQPLSIYRTDRFPVTTLERLGLSSLIEATNCASGAIRIHFYDLSNTPTSPAYVDAGAWTGTSVLSTLRGGVMDVPTGAVSAYVEVFMFSAAAGAASFAVADFMAAGVPAGQTAIPVWNPGPDADALADVTSSNTAAAISGQGGLATLSFTTLGSNVRLADGTTVATNALLVTSLGTASAISGQGAFATVSSVAYGSSFLTGFGGLAPLSFTTLGSNVRLDDGTTVATNALLVTSLGTASAISGQGGLATVNFVQFNSNVRLQDGTTIVTDVIVVTSVGTAAGITGQGWGATASESAASNALVPTGQNRLRYSRGEKLTGHWTYFSNGSSASLAQLVFGGYTGLKITGSFSAAGQVFSIYRTDRFAVTGGEKISVAGLIEAVNCGSGAMRVHFFDTGGASTSPAYIDAGSWTGTSTLSTQRGAPMTVPSGAVTAYVEVFMFSAASGSGSLAVCDLIIAGVSASQTALPVWNPGPDADSLADVTGNNTASAIAGQGVFATGNYYEQTSDPSGVPNGSWLFRTDTNELKVRRSGSWATVATLASTALSITRTNTFVKTKIGTGTNTSDTVTFAATGGTSPYTWAHEIGPKVVTGGATIGLTSTTGDTTAVTGSCAATGNSAESTIITTVTDAAGRTAQRTSPARLFWET